MKAGDLTERQEHTGLTALGRLSYSRSAYRNSISMNFKQRTELEGVS
jgi:hypothetical protein